VEIYCLPKRGVGSIPQKDMFDGSFLDCGVDKFLFCPIEISIERLVQWHCIGYVAIIKSFSSKMKTKLPFHEVLDAFGIIYPSYWIQKGVETSFFETSCNLGALLCSFALSLLWNQVVRKSIACLNFVYFST